MRKIGFLMPGLILAGVISTGLAEESRVEVKEVPDSHVVWVRTQTPIQDRKSVV